jgi:hypothetical protein
VERVGERFRLACAGGWLTGFHHVVNTSWDSRLAVDSAFGLAPPRPWLYRYKFGLHVRQRPPASAIPSVTLVLGPFGDIVDYGEGAYYLSWYPTGRIAVSTALVPPVAAALSPVVDGKAYIEPLREIVPALDGINIDRASTQFVGGWIFAWGETDIDDALSGLHRRDQVGVYSVSGYHTINTGKLTLAPLHALTLCDRIVPLN